MTEAGTVDLRRQLFGELREELGLPPDAVDGPRPLCIVEHPGSHVSDLGLVLATRLSAEAVLAAHRAGGNAEYDQIVVVPEARLAAFLAEAGETLVPPAREFLIRAGLASRSTNRVVDSGRRLRTNKEHSHAHASLHRRPPC